MPTRRITTLLTSPGLTRKLTMAFAVVILIVAMTIPIALLAYARVSDAAERSSRSTVTLQAVARFQRSLAEGRSVARDVAAQGGSASGESASMVKALNQATDTARCIASPDHKCSDAARDLQGGAPLPEQEQQAWLALRDAISVARTDFQENVDDDSDAAIAAFDLAMARNVDGPSQRLAEKVDQRGKGVRGEIDSALAGSTAMLVVVLVIALVVAAGLATIIPRRLMARLLHLRTTAHRLAHGDLTARVDPGTAHRDDEIGDLMADFNLMAMSLQTRETENRALHEQLHMQVLKEQERATRDPLTGLRNHRYFQEALDAELERCRRTGGRVSIAVLDLDDFKQVNDRFGHSEGDAVLLRATKGIGDHLRPYDLACRLGGEEFGVIFPETDAEEAAQVIERVAEHVLPFGPNGERLTFSAGVTTFPRHAQSQGELYQLADATAYTAKVNGKAQTLVYDPKVVTSMDSEERGAQRSRDAMFATALTFVGAVDRKDPYTRHHGELTAIYAATIARAMQLDEHTVKLVYRAGLLHDVGKIGIADEVLVKGDRLTHDEWVQLRMHPEFSFRILEAAEMEPVATWARHHHEHWDGSGYPQGLAGQAIPYGSRIVLVADAFESMTSDHVYRRALGVTHALRELRGGAGRQFDPRVVEVMVSLIEAGVFTQVMQQYGRVLEPRALDADGRLPEVASWPADGQAAA